MTQIHILLTSKFADLERLDNPYITQNNFTYIKLSPKTRKLNHHNGLTRCLQMAEKLLSTFAFRFRVRDRQQKCDSVLPRKRETEEIVRKLQDFMTGLQLFFCFLFCESLNGERFLLRVLPFYRIGS